MSRLIAMYSPAPQSGKSTIAEYLYSKGWHRVSFAYTLKQMLVPMLKLFLPTGLTVQDLLYGAHKETPLKGLATNTRRLMQALGTDWGRKLIQEDIWIKCWQQEVRTLMDLGHDVVTDDLRFPNEFEAVKDMGGKCWWVERPSSAAATYGHASEGSLNAMYNKFDSFITNGGSIDLLKLKVDMHISDPQLCQVSINLNGVAAAVFNP